MNVIIADVIGDITLVLIVASLLGSVARRWGVPVVVGQILAGIMLGPSLLGRLPGHVNTHLFPPAILPYLNVISQVAIVMFMFSVGYELEFRMIRGHGRAVPLLTASALGVPMGLGILFALAFRGDLAAIGEGRETRSFLLFTAVAVSITALPVLAAIVRERGLADTTAGVMATSAAGGMDALAWIVLAIAVAGTGHSGSMPWPVALAAVVCFAAVMLAVVPRLLAWWMGRSASVLSDPVPVALALAMGSAWVTASLGLHPVFGGFLAGVTMRAATREQDANLLRSMDQAGKVLLPLFFVVTGFSVNLGALHSSSAFVLLAVILVIASVGKLGPGYAVCRLSGMTARESGTVAALVNTRGLTELIALNVGLADGLINQRMFTVLVIMAVITTMMTGPLLSLIRPATAPQMPPAKRLTSTPPS